MQRFWETRENQKKALELYGTTQGFCAGGSSRPGACRGPPPPNFKVLGGGKGEIKPPKYPIVIQKWRILNDSSFWSIIWNFIFFDSKFINFEKSNSKYLIIEEIKSKYIIINSLFIEMRNKYRLIFPQ